ncbi:hypothetical protein JXA84_03995 [candidate division WOR-3 bacterium]|nr:hypothetical protein [candidate division WOR-3 bacterium]
MFIFQIFAVLPMVLSGADFSGRWQTTYGVMILEQEGQKVTGGYFFNGYCPIEGEVNSWGRLVFRYNEPTTSGEGWFELSSDGDSFTGKWREDGKSLWYDWNGCRNGLSLDTSKIWLVVLEAEWQETLDENDYSFGEMLEAFFSRLPDIEVRQRYVHDKDDLRNFCAETAGLDGRVCLLFATHGEKDGLVLRDGIAGAEDIVRVLEPCGNLVLVHFSSCNIMSGEAPDRIINSRDDWPEGFVVSGYLNPVDWAGSAVFEFFYLNLIFEQGLTPREAAKTAEYLFRFSGEETIDGIDGLGFEWKEP